MINPAAGSNSLLPPASGEPPPQAGGGNSLPLSPAGSSPPFGRPFGPEGLRASNGELRAERSGRGSNPKKRVTIHGHIVMAPPEVILHLRRQASLTLDHLFFQAKEQGSATLSMDGQVWTISRQSDHTFSIDPGVPHHFSL